MNRMLVWINPENSRVHWDWSTGSRAEFGRFSHRNFAGRRRCAIQMFSISLYAPGNSFQCDSQLQKRASSKEGHYTETNCWNCNFLSLKFLRAIKVISVKLDEWEKNELKQSTQKIHGPHDHALSPERKFPPTGTENSSSVNFVPRPHTHAHTQIYMSSQRNNQIKRCKHFHASSSLVSFNFFKFASN